jgi:hypothetical protein
MTRRIILPIEGATETECGACGMLSSCRSDDGIGIEWACNAFPNDDLEMTDTRQPARRVAACLAAEASAAQVERDARFGRAIRDAMATHDAAASIVKAAEHYIREEAEHDC